MNKDLELYNKSLDTFLSEQVEELKKSISRYKEYRTYVHNAKKDAKAFVYPDTWEVIERNDSWVSFRYQGWTLEFVSTTFNLLLYKQGNCTSYKKDFEPYFLDKRKLKEEYKIECKAGYKINAQLVNQRLINLFIEDYSRSCPTDIISEYILTSCTEV